MTRGGMIERLLLYANTARHLRWEQWVFRPIRQLQGAPAAAGLPAGRVASGQLATLAACAAGWGPPVARADVLARAQAICDGEFTFLNHAERWPIPDFRARQVSHLWSFQLHYFDYARELAWAWRLTGDLRFARRFVELALAWLHQVGQGGGDGWSPYAIAVRTVNWLIALALCGDAIDDDARQAIEEGVHRQLVALERRLERQHLANHLQKDLHALAIGALLFAGPAAARWGRRATPRLWREISEQVLPDGGHAERSPMYHALALADFLEVISIHDAFSAPVPAAARERVRLMLPALARLSREDDSLHLFNDSANGMAPLPSRLAALGTNVLGAGWAAPEGAWALPETGYFGVRDAARGERLVVDCGPPGPAHNLAHAHCDLLSFELDLAGRPVVVDSGVHGYDGDPWRAYVRSTRAHNTVGIGGAEQSETWGTFRVARRARALAAVVTGDASRWTFRGGCVPAHARRTVHHRIITREAGTIRVEDRVDGNAGDLLESWVHLHPDFAARQDGARVRAAAGAVAGAGAVTLSIEPFGVDEVTLHHGEHDPLQGWYCDQFGKAMPQVVVRLAVHANAGRPFGYRITLEHA